MENTVLRVKVPTPRIRTDIFATFNPDNLIVQDKEARTDKNGETFIMVKGKADKQTKMVYLGELVTIQEKTKTVLFKNDSGKPAKVGELATLVLEPHLIGRSKGGLFLKQ